ncbi:MAG: arginine deiminase-related protein [Gordonia sp. (in: high G+C Gram-positive bacteria)]|uniref:citrulline utilization hydrolase CtlX n=1 Tax=Gordonia sp. (in: high G+C Gram-positive bacteria) TaxID=84139 RepID=UPI0039E4DE69
MSSQAPRAVVLVRSTRFRPNPLTAMDNRFQSAAPLDVASAAYTASTTAAERLREAGVVVHLFDDESGLHPDSVFPNNWFSTHSGGRVAVYPMYAANRRGERRADVIEFLKRTYRVHEVIDYSGLEHDDVYLEGTGAMVLDHTTRIAYTARSRRADPRLLERFCTTFGYEPLLFDAYDDDGAPIYHTNVMMSVATEFALVCLDAIDPAQRAEVADRLTDSGRTVVPLTHAQIRSFAGNAIELRGSSARRLLALSTTAAASLAPAQREVIEDSCDLLPLDVTPIEPAGGSVRCMIAGIHLDSRRTAATSTTVDVERLPA